VIVAVKVLATPAVAEVGVILLEVRSGAVGAVTVTTIFALALPPVLLHVRV
jgi:hypothetical protein